MKKIIILLICSCLAVSTLLAQAPHGFKYQAIVRDASGDQIVNQEINLQIVLLQGSTNGQEVYKETHKTSTNMYGLVNLNVGNGLVRSGEFDKIDWGRGNYYIRIEMDTEGGDNFKAMGTSQLFSVPFAMYAMQSGEIRRSDLSRTNPDTRRRSGDSQGGTRAGDINSKVSSSGDSWLSALVGNVGIGTATPTSILDVNGTITTPGGTSTNWNEAYGWGDHTQAGYLSSYNELDPIFAASDAATIVAADISNWNAAFGWGDHTLAGYLISELDPVYSAGAASTIATSDITNWNTAFGWGDHTVPGYLTDEVDPKVGTNTTDFLAKWDGSQLVAGSVFDNGNVGIGTNLPTEKLDVDGNITTNGTLSINNGIANVLYAGTGSNGGGYLSINDPTGTNGIAFLGSTDSGTKGAVLIGTDEGSQNIRAFIAYLDSESASGHPWVNNWVIGTGDQIFQHGVALLYDDTYAADKTRIAVINGDPFNPEFRVDSDGDVWGAKMEMTGLKLNTGSTDGYVLISDATGNATWTNPSVLNDGDWDLTSGDLTTTTAVTGNVGIGNSSPDEKLHVSGNVKISGSLQLGTTAGIAIDDSCTAAEAGKIIFNGANFCACDGTAWKRVD